MCFAALKLDHNACVDYARSCAWEKCAQAVIESLARIDRFPSLTKPDNMQLRSAEELLP